MRVYEYSKLSGIPNKDILKMLKDGGFDIQNHMSVLPDECINYLEERQALESKKTKPAPTKDEQEKKVTEKQSTAVKEEKKVLLIKPMLLGQFAEYANRPAGEIILFLLKQGKVFNINQMLPEELVEQLASLYDIEATKSKTEVLTEAEPKRQEVANKHKRLPVVVVIGHVDHGKTTLLDFIRKTHVAAKEKGGITQHLGAYQVSTSQGSMVFLDTPGHEAFTMMRMRGIKVADIAILVVAADDGVMPQTVEAIKHAQSVNVPVIVAINKVDKVDPARIDVVKQQLSQYNLLPEDWGGQTICVPISAKSGKGVEQLLDMIALQSEVMELGADETVSARGFILESKIEKGLGPVATFIAQHGTIRVGEFFTCGSTLGKVSALIDSFGKRIKEAGPSLPVQISGFEELPKAGDYLQVVSAQEYKKAKSEKPERRSQRTAAVSEKAINLIIKTDNDSSKEAVLHSIEKLAKKSGHEFNIVHSGVGSVNENDVILAAATNSLIYTFGVKPEINALNLAQNKKVEIKVYYIIYELLDNLAELIESKKEIEYERVKTGVATIRKVFDIKGLGVIAGFYVNEGKIVKTGIVDIWRGNRKIGSGEIKSLQKEKKTMKEIGTGYEGALLIEGFSDWAIDDRAECFSLVPKS